MSGIKEYIWGTEEWLITSPLLIKKIVAKEALSVQVHPNDTYAREKEGCSGKTEMWYVLEAKPGAFLYYGLKQKISPEEFLKRIHNGTITEVCRKVPVKKGDVFYIPAGLLHAIGAGITVAEIQQSSNITYRVYDYQRTDANNQQRPLHIRQAAEVAGFLPPLQGHRPMGLPVREDGFTRTLLVQCPYFAVYHYEVQEKLCGELPENFAAVYVIGGGGVLRTANGQLELSNGKCVRLPEKSGKFEITGNVEFLWSEVPK